MRFYFIAPDRPNILKADSKNKKAVRFLSFYFTVPPTLQKWFEKKLRTTKSSDRGLINIHEEIILFSCQVPLCLGTLKNIFLPAPFLMMSNTTSLCNLHTIVSYVQMIKVSVLKMMINLLLAVPIPLGLALLTLEITDTFVRAIIKYDLTWHPKIFFYPVI